MKMSSSSSSSRFSSHSLQQLEPHVHKCIKEAMGFSEPSLLTQAMDTIQGNGDERQIKSEFNSIV